MQSEVQLCVRKTQKQRGLDREAISVKLEEKRSKRSLWLLIAVFAQALGFIYIRNVYLAFPMLEYPGKLKNLDLIEDRIQKTLCESSRNDGLESDTFISYPTSWQFLQRACDSDGLSCRDIKFL